METTLKLGKWGNSTAIRLPKGMLEQVGISPDDDEVIVQASSEAIVIKPKQRSLEKLFEGYDSSQPYPFEIVSKGGPAGDELA